MSSRKAWLARHHRDPYVKRAQAEGYRCRASYKLLEIQHKYHVMRPGDGVVDLGAAPGGWSMVAREQVGSRGQVIAIDRLTMNPIPNVQFIQGDITCDAVWQTLQAACNEHAIRVVLSDMAPNLSGQRAIDQPRSLHLIEMAADCAQQLLQVGGHFVVKVFQGDGIESFVRGLRQHYQQVKYVKPAASQSRSREVYIVAMGFKLACVKSI